MKAPNEIKVNLRAYTDPLIPRLVAALETIEAAGRWKVCRNEAIGALIDKKLDAEAAREKALGWLEHSFSGEEQ